MVQDTLVVCTRPEKAFIGVAVGLALSVAGAAHAATFQSFESPPSTGDWAGPILNVPSGTGGVISAEGVRHAEVSNVPGSCGFESYGCANYSYFGLSGAEPYVADFFQSIAVYIDPLLAAPSPSIPAFWIDMSPSAPNYGAEHNFRIVATGVSADVYVDGQVAAIVSLTSAGWYTFEMTFEKGASGIDLVTTDMNVKNMLNTVLGTTTVTSTSPTGPLFSADLGGEGFVWLPWWQDGYSGNVMEIDCIQSNLLSVGPAACVAGQVVPEPATLALLALGLAGLGFGRRKRA